MKEKLKKLPEALQKQVWYRLVASIVFFFLFLVILISFRYLYFCFAYLIFAGALLVNGGWLFYIGSRGKYIIIQGVCGQIETTGIRKRIKSITITLEGNTLKIPIRQSMNKLAVGDTVIVYFSDKTLVYEQDVNCIICNYYSLEIRNEV